MTGGDQFAMQLQYDSAGQYNGNIGSMNWRSGGGTNLNTQAFDYTYDPLGRLLIATYESAGKNRHFNVSNMDYDANGNIQSLDRQKNGANLVQLTYAYDGNQLTSVEDATGLAFQ